MSQYPSRASLKIHGLMSAARATITAAHPDRDVRRVDLVREQQIAVADHGDGHGRGDLADRIPVGGEPVAGVSRAAVDEDRVGAAVHGGLRLLQVVAILVVPSEADLRGDGDASDGPLHRLDEAADAIGMPSDRRAESLSREVIDRAAEVDVDEIRAAGLDQRRRPRRLRPA